MKEPAREKPESECGGETKRYRGAIAGHDFGAASCVAPSAVGRLEPYGARVVLQPSARGLEPEQFLTRLLEDLAASCAACGALVIGHLKCLLHTPGGVLACNLTSVRSGVSCTARAGAAARAPLEPGGDVRLDLAVLVYGLPTVTIDMLLRRALAVLLEPIGASWSLTGSSDGLHDALV
jgi:hypothetical protein